MTQDRDVPYLAGLFALTVATGVVDAASYLALDHVFTGNMTGNVLFLGFGLAGVSSVPLPNNVASLLGFLVGVSVAGRIVRGRTHATRLPTAHLVLLTATAFTVVSIGLLGLVLERGMDGWRLGLTAALAVAMGMQAVAARGARIADVTTVVITSALLNLALESPLAGGRGDRWVRRAGAVVSMGAGGALGAWLVHTWSGSGALVIGGILMVLGVAALAEARYHQGERERRLPQHQE